MIERLKRVKKRYKELVKNEGEIKNSLKKIYKAKRIIRELELRLNK